jgi:hypothetical protein
VSQAPRAKATSDASDARAAQVLLDHPPDRDYIRQDHQDPPDHDYIRPDCSRPDPEAHLDHALMAGPDEPDPYKSDALEPDWPDASASPAAAAEAFLEQADETVISPPYRHAEEPPVEPAADPQDSVWPADAKAAKAKLVSARPAAWSDSWAAREDSG